MAKNYKLTYFNFGGRAIIPRMMFTFAGVEFTDNMLPMEEFLSMKNDTSKFPLKQMPILEVDGERIIQSQAIYRYLANELDLYGSTSMDRAVVDQITETLLEIAAVFTPLSVEKSKEKIAEQALVLVEEEKVKLRYALLTDFLKKRNDGKSFFLGEKMSLADIMFYSVHMLLYTWAPTALDEYADLLALYNRIEAHEKLNKYLTAAPWFIPRK